MADPRQISAFKADLPKYVAREPRISTASCDEVTQLPATSRRPILLVTYGDDAVIVIENYRRMVDVPLAGQIDRVAISFCHLMKVSQSDASLHSWTEIGIHSRMLTPLAHAAQSMELSEAAALHRPPVQDPPPYPC